VSTQEAESKDVSLCCSRKKRRVNAEQPNPTVAYPWHYHGTTAPRPGNIHSCALVQSNPPGPWPAQAASHGGSDAPKKGSHCDHFRAFFASAPSNHRLSPFQSGSSAWVLSFLLCVDSTFQWVLVCMCLYTCMSKRIIELIKISTNINETVTMSRAIVTRAHGASSKATRLFLTKQSKQHQSSKNRNGVQSDVKQTVK